MSARILEQLLDDLPVQQFLTDHYLKLPFARRGGCRFLSGLGDLARLDRILQTPGADVIVGRIGTQYAGTSPRNLAEATSLMTEGYSIGIRHAERQDEEIAALAAQFSEEFSAPVDIHLYCTPANQPGFGWHYDAEEVFVLQTAGEKEWYLRKNTVNPLPLIETIPHDQRYEREIMPVMHCTLTAGDWLYIPSGYWHRTSAKQQSLSLSVGIKSLVAIDFLDFARPHLLESILWRQRLPALTREVHSSPNEMVKAYAAIVEGLVKDLQTTLSHPEMIQMFLDQQLARSRGNPRQNGE